MKQPKAGDFIRESYLRQLENNGRGAVSGANRVFQSQGAGAANIPPVLKILYVQAREDFTRYVTEDGVVTYRGRCYPIPSKETDDPREPEWFVPDSTYQTSSQFYVYCTTYDYSRNKILKLDTFYAMQLEENSRWVVLSRNLQRWEFMNNSGRDIPPYAIVAIGDNLDTEIDPVLSGKLQSNPICPYIINANRTVPRCCLGYGRDIFSPQWVAYDPAKAPPAYMAEWGPYPGSFYLDSRGKGLRVVGIDVANKKALVQWERHYAPYWTTETTATTTTLFNQNDPNSNKCPPLRPKVTWDGTNWNPPSPDPCTEADEATSSTDTTTTATTESTGTTTTSLNCCDGPDPNDTTTTDTSSTGTTESTATTTTLNEKCRTLIPDYCGEVIGECVATYCIKGKDQSQPKNCPPSADPSTSDTTTTESTTSSTTTETTATTTTSITDACDCRESGGGDDDTPNTSTPGCGGCAYSRGGGGGVAVTNNCFPSEGCYCPNLNVNLESCSSAFYNCIRGPRPSPEPGPPCSGKMKIGCVIGGWYKIEGSCGGACDCGFCSPAFPPNIDCDPCANDVFEVGCRCGDCGPPPEDESTGTTTTCAEGDCECRCEEAKDPTTPTTESTSTTTTGPCESYCIHQQNEAGTSWVKIKDPCNPECPCDNAPASQLKPELGDCNRWRTPCVPDGTTNTTGTTATTTTNTTSSTTTETTTTTDTSSSTTTSDSTGTTTTICPTCYNGSVSATFQTPLGLSSGPITSSPSFPGGGLVMWSLEYVYAEGTVTLFLYCEIATGELTAALYLGPGICGGAHYETVTNIVELGCGDEFAVGVTGTWCGEMHGFVASVGHST